MIQGEYLHKLFGIIKFFKEIFAIQMMECTGSSLPTSHWNGLSHNVPAPTKKDMLFSPCLGFEDKNDGNFKMVRESRMRTSCWI